MNENTSHSFTLASNKQLTESEMIEALNNHFTYAKWTRALQQGYTACLWKPKYEGIKIWMK